jgi:ketosteroid isomerase-like protein
MGSALDTVNAFYRATLDEPDLDAASSLVAPDITFIGPLQRADGEQAYMELNAQLVPLHEATRMQAQFERGDEVCSIYELDVRAPSGTLVTLSMADWITIRDGRVAGQRIYYDPREFASAFGM